MASADCWIIGNLGKGWVTNDGVKMEQGASENEWVADLTNVEPGRKWFSITTKLSTEPEDWSINESRYGGSFEIISGKPQRLTAGSDASPWVTLKVISDLHIVFNTSSAMLVITITEKGEVEPFDASKLTFYLTGGDFDWSMPPTVMFENNGDGTHSVQITSYGGQFRMAGTKIEQANLDWEVFNMGVYGGASLVLGDNTLQAGYTENMVMPQVGKFTLTISDVTETSCKLNIAIADEEVEPAYYLIGSFNNWNDDTKPAFTKKGDGSFQLQQALEAGATFKVKDQNGTWYGGDYQGFGNPFELNINANVAVLAIGDNISDFVINQAGTYTFTIANGVLTVTGFPTVPQPVVEIAAVELMGSRNEWAEPLGTFAAEDPSTGYWTLNDVVFIANDEFKIRVSYTDQSEKWLAPESDGNFLVSEEQLGNELALVEGGGNIYVEKAGTLSFALAPAFDNLVITGKFEAEPVVEIAAVELLGSSNEWAEPLGAFAAEDASTGYWTLNDVAFAANDEFKIRVRYTDQTEKWLAPESDGHFLVNEEQLGNELTLVEGGAANMYVEKAGTLSFALAPAFDNLVITGEFEAEPVVVLATSIEINNSELALNIGETITLTATVLPEDATDKSVTWTSDNESVATVADGVVTAIAAGTATITATTADGSNLSASCTVNVNAAAHNELAISDYSCMAGAAFTLDVAMNNSDEIGGFQFDLYLPEGFTVALNSKGKPDVTLNDDRVDDHTLMVNGNFDDGHYNILAFSLSNTPFIGNDGAVLHINLTAADAVAAGTHTLELRDIEISNPDGSQAWNYESLTSTITVIARGDANGDGRVSVTDVLLMAAAANGGEAAGLVLEAADMNGDGRVTVSDLLAVASLANNANGASGAPRRGMPAACGQAKARPYNGINLTATLSTDNRLAVDDVTVDPGETFTLPVRMINPDEIGGFQFDLYLPDDITVALNKKGKLDITLDEDRMDDHMLQFNNSFDDGHLHVQSFSMSNTPYYENDGPVVYVKLNVAGDATPGAYTARMRNVELSNPFGSASVWYEDGFTFGITITGEAGVTLQDLLAGGEDGGEYTVSDALAVAYACSEFAVVTDGNGNWLKVTGAELSAYGGIEAGTLSGTLSGMAANPTLTVTAAPVDAIEVPYELTTYDMAASLAPKANELATVKGYYFMQNGQPVLRGYGRAPYGQSVTLDVTNVDVSNLIEGEQYVISAVVQLREAWSGAPRKVAAGGSDAYKNVSLIVTQVPGETTAITDLNADDDAPAQRYNLLGHPVDDNYRGIVIERGRKILVR
ncbi:MAG: Ig-like domain-containing protein [Muribaculaceae bacterium]|nr:Ig-like domain-containing protein [Muribaculaceae bacterium]